MEVIKKVGYKYAIDKGYDLVVKLHADAQYASEYIKSLIDSFEVNEKIFTVWFLDQE